MSFFFSGVSLSPLSSLSLSSAMCLQRSARLMLFRRRRAAATQAIQTWWRAIARLQRWRNLVITVIAQAASQRMEESFCGREASVCQDTAERQCHSPTMEQILEAEEFFTPVGVVPASPRPTPTTHARMHFGRGGLTPRRLLSSPAHTTEREESEHFVGNPMPALTPSFSDDTDRDAHKRDRHTHGAHNMDALLLHASPAGRLQSGRFLRQLSPLAVFSPSAPALVMGMYAQGDVAYRHQSSATPSARLGSQLARNSVFVANPDAQSGLLPHAETEPVTAAVSRRPTLPTSTSLCVSIRVVGKVSDTKSPFVNVSSIENCIRCVFILV
jgi:hypothetical protein